MRDKLLALVFSFGALATAQSGSAVAQDASGVVMSEMVRISDGEMGLKQSVIVDADLEQTWAFFTEPSQIMRWMAPVADVDLRTGGKIRTHYDSCASIGDADTIELTIVNFVPQHLLTLQSNLDTAREAEWMNEEIYARRENLYNVIEFTPLDRDRTQITSWGLGYGNGPTWQTMFDFFIRGNEWSFGQLNRAIAGEEVWPDCAN